MFSTPVYQAFGLTSADLGTGATLARTYNTRGFITNETDKQVSGGATVYSYALSYHANGNVDTADDSVTGNWTYSYDTLNRVKGAAAAAGGACEYMTITWGYDAWANRESQTASGSTCTIDQPSYTINSNNTISGFSYDASGDISTDANGNNFVHDAEGRIATVPGRAGPSCST